MIQVRFFVDLYKVGQNKLKIYKEEIRIQECSRTERGYFVLLGIESYSKAIVIKTWYQQRGRQ